MVPEAGGSGLRVAVVTPYWHESEAMLRRCHESVAGQTHGATHIFVADGTPKDLPGSAQHIRLPLLHDDYGETPRLIGTLSAWTQGFDAVCWLDADCWFEPDHVERLVAIAIRERVPLVTATRMLRRQDGSLLGICTESDGDAFCDTNAYLVLREALPTIAGAWGFAPREEAVEGDRRVWQVARSLPRAHCTHPTVNYETRFAAHYLQRLEDPPPNARVIVRLPGEERARSVAWRLFDPAAKAGR